MNLMPKLVLSKLVIGFLWRLLASSKQIQSSHENEKGCLAFIFYQKIFFMIKWKTKTLFSCGELYIPRESEDLPSLPNYRNHP